MTDFTIADHGNICLLTPLSEVAHDWVAEHLPKDAPSWAGGIVVELRCLEPIIGGIAADALSISMT